VACVIRDKDESIIVAVSREGPVDPMEPTTSLKLNPPDRRRTMVVGGGVVVLATVMAIAAIGVWRSDRDAATARRAIAEGRLDEASAAVDRWLTSSPNSAEAHYLKARIAWARRDLGTVQQEIDRAAALGYPPGLMARLTGLFVARTHQAAKAEPLLRRAFDEGRGPDPEVAEALARIYLGSFRMGDARVVLDRWIREVPSDALPYLLRTEVERRTSEPDEVVIGSYREALRRDPDLDPARVGLAEMLRENHQNAEADKEYVRYLARKPDDPMGYLGAGRNALEMGDVDRAAHRLDRGLALEPRNSELLGARAAVEAKAHRFASALDYLDRAVQADPFDRANRYQRMVILTRLGKKGEAAAERQALDRIREDQVQFDRISRELVQSPLDPKLRSAAAQWLMTHGHEQEAIEWANLVLAGDPSHPAMNRLLADYYRKKGQIGLANHYEALAPPPRGDAGPR
jgi:predicted Zn-dependent protease